MRRVAIALALSVLMMDAAVSRDIAICGESEGYSYFPDAGDRALIARAKENNGDCKEVADRLDGKVPQAIVGDDGEDAIQIEQTIRRVIVDARHSDGEGVQPAPETSAV
jgi:hypothetical protein